MRQTVRQSAFHSRYASGLGGRRAAYAPRLT
ncbi:hypothetical protein QOZ94_004193 [Xanthobacter agilis]|uniref:Uncharacterized protein n=1 Tax=Xanthobacter agilis TaxID=47492 RepID=A0ABU0LJP9_XANAG|nr:hypothetical protein [Xanthobacter agilis]